MKIQNNKDNHINEESKNELRNFRQNQIKTNIKLHKVFLILVILINIGFIFFIFFYKSKISQIKKMTTSHISNINSEDTQLATQKASLDRKIVNIGSIGSFSGFRFSFIFEKSEEFQHLKNIISNYKKEKGNNIDKMEVIFIYNGYTDSDNYNNFIEKISYTDEIVIMIETIDGNKFGIYHGGIIMSKNYKFDSECKNVFLFTLDNNKIYKFKGEKKSLNLNKEKILSLGDDELVIYNEYYKNGGYIDFPLKSFDFSSINNNILTKNNGKFKINNIEVYRFLF